MPSKSPAQHRLMEAVAHDPAFAQKAGIHSSVGQEFSQADEAKASVTKPVLPHLVRALRNKFA